MTQEITMYPTEILKLSIAVFKILFVCLGFMLVAISYFQEKETNKMERKLLISLPGFVQYAISFELIISVFFLFMSIVILFIF